MRIRNLAGREYIATPQEYLDLRQSGYICYIKRILPEERKELSKLEKGIKVAHKKPPIETLEIGEDELEQLLKG